MTRTVISEGLELGGSAPPFDLLGTDGERYSLESFGDKDVLVVVFLSNGCPTVRGYDERLIGLQSEFADRGVQVVAINSNNPHLSPFDTYEEMVVRARAGGYTFPYLRDADADVAKRFGAMNTPHAFVFDRARKLRYRGRIDDARNADWVERSDVREAVAELLENAEVSIPETQPFGCAIVW
jgi:peroxiredoxin